ncbi:MAG: hypothetical protein D6719_00585 [Candidatus Dadabacteria bacterium]|nr:MAG: hypothetical protein D6719_00585 [Candidatus Dadabacteria bacterium]
MDDRGVIEPTDDDREGLALGKVSAEVPVYVFDLKELQNNPLSETVRLFSVFTRDLRKFIENESLTESFKMLDGLVGRLVDINNVFTVLTSDLHSRANKGSMPADFFELKEPLDLFRVHIDTFQSYATEHGSSELDVTGWVNIRQEAFKLAARLEAFVLSHEKV